MANLIQAGNGKQIPEGMIMNKYFDNRMNRRNQNVLLATTGGTGSGKSYYDLSMLDSYYFYRFNLPYPIENVCFSVREIMNRLNSKELKKGEMLIFEEAGANLGSLDFQNQISKIFTYVLQSFRSMNIGIVMNLPVLSMLNKSARLLLHAHLITSGIDRDINKCKCKALFHQLNQTSGKSFWKYMRIKWNGKARKIERISYSYPRKELAEEYEKKSLNLSRI